MKVKEYDVLARAVEEGIDIGYTHAFKHTDEPGEQLLKDCIYEAVMNQICEWFEFSNVEEMEDHLGSNSLLP